MVLDLQVNSWTASIHTHYFTVIAVAVADVFDTASLIVFSLVIALYLFYKKYRKYSVLLLASMGGDALMVTIAKTIVQSPRPLNGLVFEAGFSFPSGHATTCIVFCGLLTYFVWQNWKSTKPKIVSIALYAFITSLVAFDRVYLNVHWFSDVLGGCLFGIFWLTFSLWLFDYIETRNPAKFWGKIGSDPPKSP